MSPSEEKQKILMVSFNSAFKNYIEKSGFTIWRTKTLSLCPFSYSVVLRLEHEFHAYVPGDCLIQSDTNPNVMVVVKNNTIIRV